MSDRDSGKPRRPVPGGETSEAEYDEASFFDVGKIVEKIEQEQTARMKALLEVSRRMNATLDEEELLPFMMERVLELMDADHGHLVLITNSGEMGPGTANGGNQWEIKVSLARNGGDHAEPTPPSSTLIRQVIETRRPIRLDDALSNDVMKDSKSANELGLRSVMAVPLVTRGRLIGVLSVENRGNFAQFNEEHLDFLHIFAHQAAVAIENARLYRSLRDAQRQLAKAHRALRIEVEESREQLQNERQKLQILESEVRHLDKMAAMGMMVSGIAHELNNPLTGALGFAQMLGMSGGLTDRQKKMLGHITSEMNRCSEIIRNLLKFSRKDKFKRTPTDLNKLLSEAVDLRRYQFEVNNVVIEEAYDPRIGIIKLDHFQFKGVVLNMLNNAFDAIQQQKRELGRIRVVSRLVDPDTVLIEVSDNGGGIAEPEKVFDPFYTTKAVGKGTGLGMSVAYGVVKSHGGTIVAENQGDGAVIRITLPREAADDLLPEELPSAEPEPLAKGGGRILVVDDEEVIRELCSVVLEGLGYDVDTAADGVSAKRVLCEKAFDLVITDIRMPGGVSGVELFEWIKTEFPQLSSRVVFITGDLLTKDVRAAVDEVGTRLLTKPFDLDVLARVVQEAIQGA